MLEEHKDRIARIRAEWDRAEEDIKIAEQVCNKVVWPSVKELRYAGRRVIDALHAMNNGLPTEQINNLLQDAEFDCHRARHDAIDAATATIAIRLELAHDKLGYDAVLRAFPQLPALRAKLNAVMQRIRESRGDRGNREKIYAAIEAENLSDIVLLYNAFTESEDIMKDLAKRQRRDKIVYITIGVAGAVFGVIGVVVAFFNK